jgi:dihydrolipoamide dehydrogenase
MAETSFDLVVIGGGPGGYVAAIRASQLGMKTALVEREHLGGICLNWGCIPTKALLRSSEIHHLLHHLDDYGLRASEVSFDLKKVVERSRKVAAQLSRGVSHLLEKNKVEVFDGQGRLQGSSQVQVERKGGPPAVLATRHAVLAAGARARTLAGVLPDGKRIWTYKEAMVPDIMPRSVLIVGSGAIGVEFASFYRDMGAEVTIVEMMPQILPAEDEEIAATARKAFEKQGMTVHTGATVEAVRVGTGAVATTIRHDGGEQTSLEVERVILAVGIEGNVDGLGLEGLPVRVENGHVVVNQWLETDAANIYAIGDLVGPPWLAHKASHEGIVCVEKIAGVAGVHPLDATRIPACTYCRPQIASVGLTERRAREGGRPVRVGRFPYQANGKAIAAGQSEGLMKTIFDDATGELLGAHIIGAEATELIQGFVVAKTLESTEAELMRAVLPHPTLSEMIQESVLAAYGRPINY